MDIGLRVSTGQESHGNEVRCLGGRKSEDNHVKESERSSCSDPFNAARLEERPNRHVPCYVPCLSTIMSSEGPSADSGLDAASTPLDPLLFDSTPVEALSQDPDKQKAILRSFISYAEGHVPRLRTIEAAEKRISELELLYARFTDVCKRASQDLSAQGGSNGIASDAELQDLVGATRLLRRKLYSRLASARETARKLATRDEWEGLTLSQVGAEPHPGTVSDLENYQIAENLEYWTDFARVKADRVTDREDAELALIGRRAGYERLESLLSQADIRGREAIGNEVVRDAVRSRTKMRGRVDTAGTFLENVIRGGGDNEEGKPKPIPELFPGRDLETLNGAELEDLLDFFSKETAGRASLVPRKDEAGYRRRIENTESMLTRFRELWEFVKQQHNSQESDPVLHNSKFNDEEMKEIEKRLSNRRRAARDGLVKLTRSVSNRHEPDNE